MKMKRKLAVGLMLCLGMMTGCGGSQTPQEEVDYPAMELVDIGGMTLKTAENEDMKYQYDAEVWEQDEAVFNSLVTYQKGTRETEFPISLNAQVAGKYKERLTEKFMEDSLAMLEQNATITVETCEMRSFNGEPVIYMENFTAFSDAVIDEMIENEQWTEEMIEEAGGREEILRIPDSRSIIVYAVAGEKLVVYGGTYYTEDQKQMVADGVNVMLQTTEMKE